MKIKPIHFSALIAFLLFILLLPACRKGIAFGLTYQTDFTIPSTIGLNIPVNLPTPEITTNSSQEFENHDTKAKYVKAVSLQSLKLLITNPSGKTFSFLNSVHIFISAPGTTEKEVASLESIPNSVGSSISLDCTELDLATYIKSESFSLRCSVVTDETILQDVSIHATLDFNISATTGI